MHNNCNVNELIKILWTCRQEWKDIKAAEGLTEGTDYAYVTNTDEFTAADVEGMDYLVGKCIFFSPDPTSTYALSTCTQWRQFDYNDVIVTAHVQDLFLSTNCVSHVASIFKVCLSRVTCSMSSTEQMTQLVNRRWQRWSNAASTSWTKETTATSCLSRVRCISLCRHCFMSRINMPGENRHNTSKINLASITCGSVFFWRRWPHRPRPPRHSRAACAGRHSGLLWRRADRHGHDWRQRHSDHRHRGSLTCLHHRRLLTHQHQHPPSVTSFLSVAVLPVKM